jgi:hypothetical protein
MTDRTLTPAALDALTDDIRDHRYAVIQTRIERVPSRLRAPKCAEPDGCPQAPTLMTLGLAQLTAEEDGATGLGFARDGLGDIIRIPTCDDHRIEASHDLYYLLTGRTRPDGIRAFDLPGQHLQWT